MSEFTDSSPPRPLGATGSAHAPQRNMKKDNTIDTSIPDHESHARGWLAT